MRTVSNKVVSIFGPTACGKTTLLERLFLDDDRPFGRPVVIVSADSAQVYRGMDVGTAKPDRTLQDRLPHRLIDIREPSQAFSVADFVTMADAVCAEAAMAGSLPVLSGGTAYYIKAFVMGMFAAPPADPGIRAAIRDELLDRGTAAMHAELSGIDPVSAARIAPTDSYRIARALEVYRGSGQPLSSFALPVQPRGRWQVLAVGLDRPRAELHARIEARVAAMLAGGLAAEVQGLIRSGLGADDPGMKAIGYAEFLSPGLGLDEVAACIARHTRQYAKRQLTFMRALPGVRWFHADDVDGVRKSIQDFLS